MAHTLEAFSYASPSNVHDVSYFEQVLHIECLTRLVARNIRDLQAKVDELYPAGSHFQKVIKSYHISSGCRQLNWHNNTEAGALYEQAHDYGEEQLLAHLELSEVAHRICTSLFAVASFWPCHLPFSTFLVSYLYGVVA